MRSIEMGTARGPGEARDQIQLGDMTLELVGDDAVLARDAAARLGSTLEAMAKSAVDLPWGADDVDRARHQLLRFARAVVR